MSVVKRVMFRLTTLALVMVMLFAGADAALGKDGQYGVVTGMEVKLREKPNTECEVLGELPLNAQVEVLAEEGSWYRVLYEGVVGYVRSDYLFVNVTGTRAAYVLEDGAKLRGAPSMDSYVAAELSAGQGIKIKQMIGEWYFAIAGDDTGYIHRSYVTMAKGSAASGSMLRVGMEGQEVKRMQQELSRRGFLSRADATGLYGAKTRSAVTAFQKAAELSSKDGIAGAETLAALYDSSNNVMKENATYNRIKGTVVLLDWFKGGSDWLAKGTRFTITDVRTGLSFKARRFGGWYHADSEPCTANDTAIMKRIAGGSWSWNRRAIWVTIGGKTVAASMHCMPHMVNPTKSNNFDGHFCVHLLNSKVHETSKPCPRHQSCVQSAYKSGK